jgi:MFS family permease
VKIRESVASFLGLKGNIIPIFNLELLSNIGWHMFEVIWQPFVLSLGASVAILGALDGFNKALKSLLQLFMGRISDRVGRKKPIYFSYAFMLTGLILFIAARSWIWLVPALIMWAFSDSIWEPIFPTIISESVEEDKRGTAFSVWSLTWSIPGFFAPALGGYIANLYGYKSIMVFMIVGEFSAFLIFKFMIKETLERRKALRLGNLLDSLRGIFKPPPELSRFYAAAILAQFVWFLGEALLPAMLIKTYDFSLVQLGILANVVSLSALLFQIPLGRFVDRYGGKPLLVTAGIVWSLIFMGYIVSKTFISFMVCKVLRGLIVAAWEPAYNSYLSGSVPDEERAKTYGDLNCMRGLICFPAPLIGALLFENYGFNAPLWAGLALNFVAIALFATIPRTIYN